MLFAAALCLVPFASAPALDAPLASSTVALDAPLAPKETEIAQAIVAGRALLVERQESLGALSSAKPGEKRGNDEWPYEGVYRVKGAIPIGYRIGGTSICALALVESEIASSVRAPRKSIDRALDAPARAAVERALAFVLRALDEPLMSVGFDGTYDVRGWGHAYALAFLLDLRRRELVEPRERKAVDERIRWLVDALQRTEIKSRGGWNYARASSIDDCPPSTFMTAPTLQILFEAARQGENVDAAVVGRALDALEAARLDTGAFQYGSDPAHKTGKGFEDVPGSIGRSPVCETTLLLAGRGSVERVRGALEAFFTHWEWLEKRRKQNGTHVAPYYIAPYYFFYAHRFAAQAIEMLPEAERPALRARLDALLWKVREDDGGWNDRVFPRSECFGTAMTILALCEPALERPATWSAPRTAK